MRDASGPSFYALFVFIRAIRGLSPLSSSAFSGLCVQFFFVPAENLPI